MLTPVATCTSTLVHSHINPYRDFRMGNSINSESHDLTSDQCASFAQSKPLKFHEVFSRGVAVSPNRLVLRCLEQGSGMAFSDRPIQPEEIVCLKVVMFHKGALRFGVTTCDPANLCPEILGPFFSRNSKSIFLKEVSSGTTHKNALIFFKVTREGNIVYGWQRKEKEKDKGVLISDVPVHIPLWAVFDISGRNIALRLEGDTLYIAKAKSFRKKQKVKRAKSLETLPSIINPEDIQASISTDIPNVCSFQEHIHFSRPRSSSISAPNRGSRQQSFAATETSSDFNSSESSQSSVRAIKGRKFSRFQQNQIEERVPMCFHCRVGKNINLSSERTTATNRTGMSNGYVFTRRPLWIDEKLVISVLKVRGSSGGSLGFGLTVCDPKAVAEFPDDADELLDREEYWVFAKEACTNLAQGDELAFIINNKGEVGMSKNKLPFRTLMHVDPLMMFWAFFDITGTLEKISSLGTVLHARRTDVRPNNRAAHPPRPVLEQPMGSTNISPAHPTNQGDSSSSAKLTTVRNTFDPFADLPPLLTPPLIPVPCQTTPAVPSRIKAPKDPRKHNPSSFQLQTPEVGRIKTLTSDEIESLLEMANPSKAPKTSSEETSQHECSVCLENPPDCVLYTCGHMCLCYECSQNIIKGEDPLCPLCRRQIADVIKIYKS